MMLKKIPLFLSVGLLSCAALWAREVRTVDCLDENWSFARYGLQPDGLRLSEPDSLWAVNVDDRGWRRLDLPHDWGVEGPFRQDLDGYTGKLPWRAIGWYRKHFSLSAKDRSRRVYVDFDGAMANAEVWVNGQKAGGHPYGYSSFRIDITPYVKFGRENVMAVRLNTEEFGSRWYPGGGIYRHVRLVKTSPVHIAHWGVFVTTPRVSEQCATAWVEVTTENYLEQRVEVTYSVDIHELDAADRLGRRVATAGCNAFRVPAGGEGVRSVGLAVERPRLWSLEATHRYTAKVTVFADGKKVDEYFQPFGFRTIEFTHDRGFLLNGKRVPLRGTCNHHDLGALGAAIHTSALRRQLEILKSFGCNALRTSHNPPAPELPELADKLGLLVLAEGCGRVIATDNGDATCHIAFSQPTRPAFNGLLLAIVKPLRGEKGKIRFTAKVPGLPEQSLTLKVIR